MRIRVVTHDNDTHTFENVIETPRCMPFGSVDFLTIRTANENFYVALPTIKYWRIRNSFDNKDTNNDATDNLSS